MKKMQSSGGMSARMSMDENNASQMDLNAPSNNDISADVGFNTTPAPSALIKNTPGANVSVEPATQQNGAPSENSNQQNAGKG